MVTSIHEEIWKLSPAIDNPEAYKELVSLTQQLIAIHDEEGRLDENPFTPTTKRKLFLPREELEKISKNAVCLVTGFGCVGRCLVEKLSHLAWKQIIVMDINALAEDVLPATHVTYVQGDISVEEDLDAVFNLYRPEFIFHTAAQRDPGLAEIRVQETVMSNVIGTWNVVKTCERYPFVKQCTFSSTGKASRYYTEEVYAATKKICEYTFDTYARGSKVKYSMVRFTHILENSLMNIGFRDAIDAPYLAIHSPGKYVTAQNVSEAGDLLLNAMLSSGEGQCNFSLVRHLEWPVESLEVALYYIKQRGSKVPIIFQGNPKGYCEKFFRGQMNWSDPDELNLLINVYEYKHRSVNAAGDIVVSQISPTDPAVLLATLKDIEKSSGDVDARYRLLSGLRDITKSALKLVDKNDTVNILKWGLEPGHLEAQGQCFSDFNAITSLLKDSLIDSPSSEQIKDLTYAL